MFVKYPLCILTARFIVPDNIFFDKPCTFYSLIKDRLGYEKENLLKLRRAFAYAFGSTEYFQVSFPNMVKWDNFNSHSAHLDHG